MGVGEFRKDPEGSAGSGEERAKRESRLVGYEGTDRVVQFLAYLREKGEIDTKIKRFETGFIQLDGLTEGFETGEMIVITGPTGNGKTLLAESIGKNLMQQGANALWFSYEVATASLLKKYQVMDTFGLYVPMQLKAGDFTWLVDRCLEAKLKYDCRIVFIDHLHYLVDMSTKLNMSLNIGGVLRQLKNIVAVGMNMVVVLICHQEKSEKDTEASLDRSRDSSFIGQECDIGLVVFRSPDPSPVKGMPSSYEQGWATVKVDKARRAGTFRKKLSYIKKGPWLEEF